MIYETKRDALPAISNFYVKKDGATVAMKPGDIVAFDQKEMYNVEMPVLDVIGDATDPILFTGRLSNAPQWFGNIYDGDSVDQLQKQNDQQLIDENPQAQSDKMLADAAKELNHKAAIAHAAKPKKSHLYFNVINISYKDIEHGKLVSVLVTDHQTRQTFWIKKRFGLTQSNQLKNFYHNIKRGEQVYGELEPNSEWFKYLYPCHQK